MSKTRYKMYKKGKHWIVAGIVSGAVMLGAGNVTAQADTGASADVGSSLVTEESGTGKSMANDSTQEPAVKEAFATAPGAPVTDEAAEVGDSNEEVEPDVTTVTSESLAPVTDQPASGESSAADSDRETPADNVEDVTISDESAGAKITPPVTRTPTVPEVTMPAGQPVAPATSTKVHAESSLAAVPLVKKQLARQSAPVVTAADPATTNIDQWMPNKTLQKVILLTLQDVKDAAKTWKSVADITQDDLLLLTTLDVKDGKGYDTYIDGKTPFSLEGLQYATNLTWLSMGASLNIEPGAIFGDIVDVTPLTNLQKLTSLDLQGNRIEDISPLANLKNLDSLYLAYNHIRDFSPLKGFKGDMNSLGQFIMLDPLLVSDKDRTGHMQVQCITIDGEVVQLTVGQAVIEPVFASPEKDKQDYHFYFTGGKPKPDGNGGIYFDTIQDQQPGSADSPISAVNAIALPDHYYLTGHYGTDFNVVQPYIIVDTAADVIVHYQDKDGKKLADDKVLSGGLIGEDYKTTPIDVPGYKLTGQSENTTGKFSKDKIEVTYVYKQVAGPVTVHYRDKDEQKVADDKVLPEKSVGDDYTTTPMEIPGYKLVKVPTNATGKYGKESIDVTYYYAQTAASVTVQYQDKDGQKLAADKVLPEKSVGDDYTTTPIEIPGYTLMGQPTNASGKYSTDSVTVTYIYAKNEVKPPVAPPVEQTTLTVHHQTADGKVVAQDDIYSGAVGMTYVTYAASPAGYKLKKTPGNATGTFGEKDFEITYIYELVETGGSETPGPGTPGGGDNSGGETPDPGTPGDGNNGGGETPAPGNPGDGNTGGCEGPNPGNPGGGETPNPGTPGGGNNGGGQTPGPSIPGPSAPDTGNNGNGNEIPGTSQPGTGTGTDNPGQTPVGNIPTPVPDTSTGGAGDGANATTLPSNPSVAPTPIISAGSPATISVASPNRPTSTISQPQSAVMLPQTGEKPTQSSVWGFICLSVTWGVLGLLGVKRKMR